MSDFDGDENGVTVLPGYGSSAVAILVQSNLENLNIMKYCFSTWIEGARTLGYDVVVLNYTKSLHLNYFEQIEKFMQDYSYKIVIMNFDDLYFHNFNLVPSRRVELFFEENRGSLLRLDARGVNVKLNTTFTPIPIPSNVRYAKSSVLAALDKAAVTNILKNNIKRAWDLEVDVTDFLEVYVVPACLKYDNLIVKGKMDIYHILKHSALRIPLYVSLYKLITRRGIGAIIRKRFRKIKLWGV